LTLWIRHSFALHSITSSARATSSGVRHFWSCENFGHEIEMTVNPRINAASKLSQGVEWSIVG